MASRTPLIDGDGREASYQVGFARPPVHTQFKPGRSGNPKGRPKGSQNIATALERELNTRITITENGRQRTITKLEATVKQLVNKAASGDTKSMQLLVGLTRGIDATAADVTVPLSREADEQVKHDLLRRMQKVAAGANE